MYDVMQVRLFLNDKFADRGYEFKNIKPNRIKDYQRRSDGHLLIQGCLNRAGEQDDVHPVYDHSVKQYHTQLLTLDAEEVGCEFDKDWMHVILVRKSRFYCHNLDEDWKYGAPIAHLGLNDEGQPKKNHFYMRYISRVYWVKLF